MTCITQVRNTKQSHTARALKKVWELTKQKEDYSSEEVAFPFLFLVSGLRFQFPFPVSVSFPFPAFHMTTNHSATFYHMGAVITTSITRCKSTVKPQAAAVSLLEIIPVPCATSGYSKSYQTPSLSCGTGCGYMRLVVHRPCGRREKWPCLRMCK